MSYTNLLGVLRMPPDLWDGGAVDVLQRRSRYVEAADEIERLSKREEALMGQNKWLINTLEWLSGSESNGGITTCEKHNGHGFQSDCAICSKLRELKEVCDV